MKKKGFTLVELLAVIAILAILVIVAMPNVLGMFNQAKANTFVTEVQEYMNTATTSFMQNALMSQGKSLYFGNGSAAANTVTLGKLDMSGTEKSYFIQMDRNGEFERVVIYDDNFCYDSAKAGLSDGFEKTDIKVTSVYEVETADSTNKNAVSASTVTDGDVQVGGCAALTVAQQ